MALVLMLALAFAYGLGVGARSWFPYSALSSLYSSIAREELVSEASNISLAELRSGSYLIHIRHADRLNSIESVADFFEMMDEGHSDWSSLTCLSPEGLVQAKLTGRVFRELDIFPTRVVSSGSCRANEHALAAFGRLDIVDPRHLYLSTFPQAQHEARLAGQVSALLELDNLGGLTVIFGHEPEPYNCAAVQCVGGASGRVQGGVSTISRVNEDLVELHRYETLSRFFVALAP